MPGCSSNLAQVKALRIQDQLPAHALALISMHPDVGPGVWRQTICVVTETAGPGRKRTTGVVGCIRAPDDGTGHRSGPWAFGGSCAFVSNTCLSTHLFNYFTVHSVFLFVLAVLLASYYTLFAGSEPPGRRRSVLWPPPTWWSHEWCSRSCSPTPPCSTVCSRSRCPRRCCSSRCPSAPSSEARWSADIPTSSPTPTWWVAARPRGSTPWG